MNSFILAIFLIFFGHLSYASEVAAVLGYENASKDKLWQESQIGFGVKNILQQALQEHTDYILLDEKVDFGINKENLEEHIQAQWMLTEQQTSVETLKNLAQKYNVTHFYWVKITDFATKTSKISIAFLNSSEYKDTLNLQVCHYSFSSNTINCEDGEATQSRTLTGVLYNPTSKVNFKESGAGSLSQEAINQSLEKLLHHDN